MNIWRTFVNKDISPNSLIGEGAIFEGNFYVAGSFRIDGHFEGQLKVEEHLFISPVGKLKTDTVYAKTIAVAGIFMGNIEVTEEVQLLSTGRILGNIKAPKLIIEPGVVVQGTIDITGSRSSKMNDIIATSFKDSKNSKDIYDTEPPKELKNNTISSVDSQEKESPKDQATSLEFQDEEPKQSQEKINS